MKLFMQEDENNKKVRELNPTRRFFQKKILSFYLLVCCFLFTFTTE